MDLRDVILRDGEDLEKMLEEGKTCRYLDLHLDI